MVENNEIVALLNTPLFTTIATLAAGVVAYLVYIKQKQDKKRDIANAILSEIRSAEIAIDKVRDYVRDNEKVDINIKIVEYNSWTKYRYIFSNDLDGDQWREISNFYSNAELLDEVIRQANSVFEGNADKIRSNMQRVLADMVGMSVINSSKDTAIDDLTRLNEKLAMFDQIYDEKKNSFVYTPQKYLNDAKRLLEDLHTISTTSTGDRIKRLAGKK